MKWLKIATNVCRSQPSATSLRTLFVPGRSFAHSYLAPCHPAGLKNKCTSSPPLFKDFPSRCSYEGTWRIGSLQRFLAKDVSHQKNTVVADTPYTIENKSSGVTYRLLPLSSARQCRLEPEVPHVGELRGPAGMYDERLIYTGRQSGSITSFYSPLIRTLHTDEKASGAIAPSEKQHEAQPQQVPKGPTFTSKGGHEEGPSVPYDTSVTAEELRHSWHVLVKRMQGLAKCLVVLGIIQVADALWCTFSSTPPVYSALLKMLPAFSQTFILAYLAHQAAKPLVFLMTMEKRSRLRLVTVALQASKGMADFFSRAALISAVVAIAGIITLGQQVYPAMLPLLQQFGL